MNAFFTSPFLLSLVAVIVVSLISLVGIFFFVVNADVIKDWLLTIVSFSTGAMLGDVFIHMLPEMAEDSPNFGQSLYIVLGGVVASFAVEKLIRWRHCHMLPEGGSHEHCHTAGFLTLVGDGVHNFIDGVIIAVSFLVSMPLGLATTLAVIFHEIPQEIGNFAVLLHDGYEPKRALLYNFISALTAVAGTVLVFVVRSSFEGMIAYLLPFAAGNFLYIAGADLIPELHRDESFSRAWHQLIAMVVGIALMYGLTLLE
jgi:zinc and cadmium transporter